jgi:hypothetical protein
MVTWRLRTVPMVRDPIPPLAPCRSPLHSSHQFSVNRHLSLHLSLQSPVSKTNLTRRLQAHLNLEHSQVRAAIRIPLVSTDRYNTAQHIPHPALYHSFSKSTYSFLPSPPDSIVSRIPGSSVLPVLVPLSHRVPEPQTQSPNIGTVHSDALQAPPNKLTNEGFGACASSAHHDQPEGMVLKTFLGSNSLHEVSGSQSSDSLKRDKANLAVATSPLVRCLASIDSTLH